MPILKGLPAACSASARLASAEGTALGHPAAVKPLKPTLSSLFIKHAASSAVITGNLVISLYLLNKNYCKTFIFFKRRKITIFIPMNKPEN
jgi:hypothetical protein